MSTARSRRRDAELAVIDAAKDVDDEWHIRGDGGCSLSLRLTLNRALAALKLLDFETPDAVRTGLDNPNLTSSKAAEWMKTHASDLAGQVFTAIYTAYLGGSLGMTTEAIEQHLSGKHQSISPRVTELRDKGFIKPSGLTRKTRSKRDAIVWTPTTIAIEAARKEGLPWSWTTEPSSSPTAND